MSTFWDFPRVQLVPAMNQEVGISIQNRDRKHFNNIKVCLTSITTQNITSTDLKKE